ncbi:hypothetical protein PVAP13_9NG787677 [Panicum virgatum]|uniref:Uncharacterized protein n=1 Tax=Panicum virgatum TaxID=38727 RepID=A0A8T0N6Y3_PANVG|nr:hypothetical protein PVAP13_9NG787677 [Panicum virgatum]
MTWACAACAAGATACAAAREEGEGPALGGGRRAMAREAASRTRSLGATACAACVTGAATKVAAAARTGDGAAAAPRTEEGAAAVVAGVPAPAGAASTAAVAVAWARPCVRCAASAASRCSGGGCTQGPRTMGACCAAPGGAPRAVQVAASLGSSNDAQGAVGGSGSAGLPATSREGGRRRR